LGKLEILLATSTEYTLYAKWFKKIKDKEVNDCVKIKKSENKDIWSVKT